MNSIRFATFLGDNTLSISRALSEYLSAALDVPVEFDASASRDSEDAIRVARSGEFDVLWACGRLLIELIDSDVLDADIVAAPVFDGETKPVYRSVIVARADLDLRSLSHCEGLRLAVNEPRSWSGHHGFIRHLGEHGRSLDMFGSTVPSGSHRGSVDALIAGVADVAAIDHTIWNHLVSRGLTGDGSSDALVVFDQTKDWPAPPFVIGRSLPDDLRAALAAALLNVADSIDGLAGVSPAKADTYDDLRPR